MSWGIEDFVYRFGRRPLGMWLPECAVDEETLAALAQAGIQLYDPGGQNKGRFESAQGIGSAGEVGPFEWRRGDLSIAVLRFERELSGQIAFSDMLNDGARVADGLAHAAFAQPPGSAVMIATDGETFGHHKKHGAAELARAFEILAERDGLVVTNCAEYLAGHAPRGRFEIDGASAWSCAHGVERWRSNCGCRLEGNTSQEWRGPLREAMEFIKNHADAVYDRCAAPLVADPGAALKEVDAYLLNLDNQRGGGGRILRAPSGGRRGPSRTIDAAARDGARGPGDVDQLRMVLRRFRRPRRANRAPLGGAHGRVGRGVRAEC